jgi:hypothetical protein
LDDGVFELNGKEAPGLDLTVEEEGNQDFTLEDESEDDNQNSVHHSNANSDLYLRLKGFQKLKPKGPYDRTLLEETF